MRSFTFSLHSFQTRRLLAWPCLLAGILAAGARPASAQNPTVFADEFNGASLDMSQWQAETNGFYLQRTEWGLQPTIAADADGTRFLRVPLNTYDPTEGNTGSKMQGCQIHTLKSFGAGSGMEFEARLRSNNLPAGLVLGFFPYGQSGEWTSTYKQTEIDYEFLTNWGGSSIWSNIWDDYNPERGGPNSGVKVTLPSLNWNNNGWNTFVVDWYPDHTNWVVNGTVLRTETSVKPGDPMGLTLNLWAPASGWGTAYSASLAVQNTAAKNQKYFYDVDYVRVRPLNKTSSATIGTGTGLTGAYYGNMTMSGTPAAIQLDPRINFNWGANRLVPALGATGTSAKWTGFIQPQYNESYTFTTTSDDGSRLYVNNQLIVSNWRDQSATAKSGTIALLAGKLYPIEVDYYQNGGGASMQLTWKSKSTINCIVPQSQLYPAAQPAMPTFSVGTGTYSKLQTVTISSATAGSTIYYTQDGSAPSTASPSVPNGGTVPINSTGLLCAIAVVSGQVPSPVATAYYTYVNPVKPVVAVSTPAANAILPSLATVSGTASEPAAGIGLSYVNLVITRMTDSFCWNGSSWVNQQYGLGTALESGTWTYSGPLPAGANLAEGAYSVKAVAYDYVGNLAVATNNITINSFVPAAPTFSIPGGTYSQFQSVTIRSATAGATIYYTTDGTTPTAASPSLANGASLTVNKTETLSAIAVVPGAVPSPVTTASYAVVNSVKPVVAVLTPANNAALKSLGAVTGTASEPASGVGLSYVRVVITRASDGLRWNGTAWVNQEYGLQTALSGGNWTCNAPMPFGTNLLDGSYAVKAVAYDFLNNTAIATNTVLIDGLSPTVTITSPLNGATLSSWTKVTGTAVDRNGGSGLEHVALVITRASDGAQWNGWVWLTTPTGIPTTLSAGTFSAVNTAVPGIPTGTNLAAGSYTIKAVAYDVAGNAATQTVTINISAGGTVQATTKSNQES